MKHEKIAKILRQYRKQQHMSVQDVVVRLNQEAVNVSPKTVYAWENGATQPDIGTMLLLCRIYQIPNLQQLMETAPKQAPQGVPVLLSEAESDFIQKYREHPEMHDAIKKLLG